MPFFVVCFFVLLLSLSRPCPFFFLVPSRGAQPFFGLATHHPRHSKRIMSSFMLRSGYAELAKKVHSISGSVTTIFLFTRLWARSSRHGGLWRDDYIRE